MTEPRYALDDFNTIAGHAENGAGPERDSWLPLNLADLPAHPPVQPTLGHGLVYPGKRHVFSGPQESAKTLAAYAIAIDTVRAGHAVVLIDFEMGAYDARNRLRELGATPDDLNGIHYIEPAAPASPERTSLLIALNPTLVIIDAAAGAYHNEGLDDNARKDVEIWTSLYIRDFWQAGIATILIDHVVKNTGTRGKYAIGSERKTGGVDVHLGFDTIVPISRGTAGLYKIVTHKDRPGHHQRGRLADLHLISDPLTHTISYEFRPVAHEHQPGTVWMPTLLMEKISATLEKAGEPMSRNQLELAVGGNAEKKRDAIDHLVRLKHLREDVGPNRYRSYTLLRRFTVSQWEAEEEEKRLKQATDEPGRTSTKSEVGENGLVEPNTTYNQVRPSSSKPRPDELIRGSSSSSPPYRGTDDTSAPQTTQVRPDEPDQETLALLETHGLSWIDELAYREDPPADLFDQPTDDLPL